MNTMRLAEKMSIPQLTQALQTGQIDPSVGQIVLHNKIKMKQRMEQAQQAAQPPQPSVAQADMSQAQQTPAPLPTNMYTAGKGYAEGGVVGFAGGGAADDYFPLDSDTRARLRQMGYGPHYPLDKATLERLRVQGVLDGNNTPRIDSSTRPGTGFSIGETPPAQALQKMLEDKPNNYKSESPGSGFTMPDLSGVKNAATIAGKALIGYPILEYLKDKVTGPPGVFYEERPTGTGAPPQGIAGVQPPPQTPPPQQPPPQSGGGGLPSIGAPQVSLETVNGSTGDSAARIAELSRAREADYAKGDEDTFKGIRADIDKQRGRIADVDNKNLYLSLIKGGLATAAGKSQYAMTNIGEGAQEGVNQYVQRDVLNRAMENQLSMRDQALKMEELAQRKGNKSLADKYGQDAIQAEQTAKQIQIQAAHTNNQSKLGLAGLNLEGQRLAQQGQFQNKMLDVRQGYTDALKAQAHARMQKVQQDAIGKFMSTTGSALDMELKSKYGPGWRTGQDAKSREAQYIFGQALHQHMSLVADAMGSQQDNQYPHADQLDPMYQE
jgi:hypothetical protein